MLDLLPRPQNSRDLRFLFIGAHADDIEIGCGATILELVRRYPDAEIHWVVLSAEGTRRDEAENAAQLLLGTERAERVDIREFRGAYFPSEWVGIKDFLETLKPIEPDVVFAHHRDDLHQDHRTVGELVWNTFRDHLILEYEIPKYDGGLGSPSMFVPVSSEAAERKIEVLMQAFPSQTSRAWFTRNTFEAMMRLRGVECNAPSGFAEAFYARKIVLGHP